MSQLFARDMTGNGDLCDCTLKCLENRIINRFSDVCVAACAMTESRKCGGARFGRVASRIERDIGAVGTQLGRLGLCDFYFLFFSL